MSEEEFRRDWLAEEERHADAISAILIKHKDHRRDVAVAILSYALGALLAATESIGIDPVDLLTKAKEKVMS